MLAAGSLRIETFEGSRPHLRLMGFQSDVVAVSAEIGTPQGEIREAGAMAGGRQLDGSAVIEDFGGDLRAVCTTAGALRRQAPRRRLS